MPSASLASAGIYAQALGAAFGDLPPGWRALHEAPGRSAFAGQAVVTRGEGALTGRLADLFGFPKAGEAAPVRLDIVRKDGEEFWTRDFGGASYTSRLTLGGAPGSGLISERMGAVTAVMQAAPDGNGVDLPVRKAFMFGLPLPRWLTPRSQAREYQDEKERFCFDVDVGLPGLGRVVHYRGWLRPVTEEER